MEVFLLDRILKGQFDNKNCKKGRKKNYDEFFQKNLLHRFIVAEDSPEAMSPVKESP